MIQIQQKQYRKDMRSKLTLINNISIYDTDITEIEA